MAPQRTIDEWVTLFELEPTIRHVFVEGETDQRSILAQFRALNYRAVDVRTVQEVRVPSSLVARSPFSSGNRAKLIVFAQEIVNRAVPGVDNVRCVVDRDSDVVLPVVREEMRLVQFSDFANLPIYFAQVGLIQHVIHAVYGRNLSVDDFEEIVRATRFLFAVRILRYGILPSAKGVDPYGSLAVIHDQLIFEETDYVRRFVLANGVAGREAEILQRIEAIYRRLVGDPRYYMNFHDFFALLYGAMKRRRYFPSGVRDEEFERVFWAAFNSPEKMQTMPMMQALAGWAANI